MEDMEPGLYVVGTPIGNLGDITMRALATLRDVDIVLAEDTRQTRKLFNRYEIQTGLVSCHKFNEASRVQWTVDRVRAGESIGLVTDSGMPAISDPGARMVGACREAGIAVTVVPGPSAVTAAIALSGCVEKQFLFEGFLPLKAGKRRRRIQEIASETRPVVLFESPYRFSKLLNLFMEIMPERHIFVGRELTKRFEECRKSTVKEMMADYAGRTVKGELVIVTFPDPQR